MRRRTFLKNGMLGIGALAGLPAARGAMLAPQPATSGEAKSVGTPIIVSTWNHGMAANQAAARILQVSGASLKALVRGVMVTEADPKVTSVGRGGYPNIDGVVELDAAVMNGDTLEVGAVAGLQGILNPIAVAEKVMTESPHTLLVGDGAKKFALSQGFQEENLLTEAAKKAWEARKGGKKYRPAGSGADQGHAPDAGDADAGDDPNARYASEHSASEHSADPDNHDTIGTIVLDAAGSLHAGCSTSGAAWKLPGRVGDSPIVGHGLYADSDIGAVVATGLGEEFAKICGSFAVIELMRQGVEPKAAIEQVIGRAVKRDGRNRTRLLAMVALRRDGVIGAASSTPGFQIAVTKGTEHELIDIEPLYPPKKKD